MPRRVLPTAVAFLLAGCTCGFDPVRDCSLAGACDAGTSDGGLKSIEVLTVRLPEAVHEAAVAFDGQSVWVMGGMTSQRTMSRAVIRFDPATDTLFIPPVTLPYGRQSSSAAKWGEHIYIFGGRRTETVLMDEILRFTPATGEMKVMAAKLPTPRYNMGVGVTATEILLFGGYDYTTLKQVLSYAPLTDTLTVHPTGLPTERQSPDPFAVGDAFDVLGGGGALGIERRIVRFSPSTGQLTTLTAELASPTWGPASGLIGGIVYLYGGTNEAAPATMTVTAYDPTRGSVGLVTGVTLPEAHHGRSTASVGDRLYIFGGVVGDTGVFKNSIIRFTPPQ